MNRWSFLLIVGSGIAVLIVRRDDVVPVIRWLDRHVGLASRHAEDAYARSAMVFRGLHEQVAIDAVRTSAQVIVDVGAGPGDVLEAIHRRAPDRRLIGIEPSRRMRELAAERGVQEIDGRAEAIPLPAASADLILSTLSSHHWDDGAAAFAEFARVLRTGGEARIYDVRFAGFRSDEVERLAGIAGIAPGRVRRRVLETRRFGFRPYAVITIAGS